MLFILFGFKRCSYSKVSTLQYSLLNSLWIVVKFAKITKKYNVMPKRQRKVNFLFTCQLRLQHFLFSIFVYMEMQNN